MTINELPPPTMSPGEKASFEFKKKSKKECLIYQIIEFIFKHFLVFCYDLEALNDVQIFRKIKIPFANATSPSQKGSINDYIQSIITISNEYVFKKMGNHKNNKAKIWEMLFDDVDKYGKTKISLLEKFKDMQGQGLNFEFYSNEEESSKVADEDFYESSKACYHSVLEDSSSYDSDSDTFEEII